MVRSNKTNGAEGTADHATHLRLYLLPFPHSKILKIYHIFDLKVISDTAEELIAGWFYYGLICVVCK